MTASPFPPGAAHATVEGMSAVAVTVDGEQVHLDLAGGRYEVHDAAGGLLDAVEPVGPTVWTVVVPDQVARRDTVTTFSGWAAGNRPVRVEFTIANGVVTNSTLSCGDDHHRPVVLAPGEEP